MYKLLSFFIILLVYSCRLADPMPPINDGKPSPNDHNTLFFEQLGSKFVFQTNNPAYLHPQGYNFWHTNLLQPNNNILQVTIVNESGFFDDGFGYGLLFSVKDDLNFMILLIDAHQYYTLGYVDNGRFSYITNSWQRSDALRAGKGQANKISIEAISSSLFNIRFNDSSLLENNVPFIFKHSSLDHRSGLVVTLSPSNSFPASPLSISFSP